MQPDYTVLQEFFALPIDQMALRFLVLYGWMFAAVAFLWAAGYMWMFYVRQQFFSKQNFILLAIDVPRGNEQSPKAVENIFNYLAGMQGSANLIMKYWDGWVQLSTSLEIVSVEGYIQFLIRTPSQFRDLVESAIYSQYPDAEVTEIEDYIDEMPKYFPNEEYDVFGWEWVQANNKMLPIKTYKDFEHQMSSIEAGQFKDPMANLMSLFNSISKGEQIWYQIIIIPINYDWAKDADKEIDAMLGGKPGASRGGIVDMMFNMVFGMISLLSDWSYTEGTTPASTDKGQDELKMLNLKPKQKAQVEGINEKAGKVAFEFKMRMVYFAPHEVMKINKAKVVNGFAGYMKIFTKLDLNFFKPSVPTMTVASYLFVESTLNRKKNSIVFQFRNRDDSAGAQAGLLNAEELATLWHFPLESAVNVPMLKKVEGKKVEAPMVLPVAQEDDTQPSSGSEDIFKQEQKNNEKEEASPTQPLAKKAMPPIGLGTEEEVKENINELEDDTDAPPGNLPIG